MRTIFTDTDSAEMAPCVATIGFFDGVHRGHRYLIKSVTDCAAASSELQSTVITFDRHPRQVLNMEFQPKLLSTLDEKLALLSKTGADNFEAKSATAIDGALVFEGTYPKTIYVKTQ